MHTYTERFPTRCFPYLWQVVIPLHTLALGWSDVFETSPERDLGGLRHDNRLNKHIFYLVASYLVESVHLQICDNAINWNPTAKNIHDKKILSNLLHGSHPLLFLCRKMDCHPSLTFNSFEVFLVSKIAGFSKEYFSHQHHQQQEPQTASLPRAPQGPAKSPWI